MYICIHIFQYTICFIFIYTHINLSWVNLFKSQVLERSRGQKLTLCPVCMRPHNIDALLQYISYLKPSLWYLSGLFKCWNHGEDVGLISWKRSHLLQLPEAQLRTQHPLMSKARVAKDMYDSIPARAANMIKSGTFAGGALIKVESDVSRPSFRDRF